MVSFVFGTEWNLSGRPSEENSHSTVSTSTPETRESPTKRSEFSPHLRLHPSLWLELVRSMYGQSGHGVDAPRPSGGLGIPFHGRLRVLFAAVSAQKAKPQSSLRVRLSALRRRPVLL